MLMRGLLLRIKELSQSTCPAVRSLAENISRDPRAAVACTIRDLADMSHASASTVVRFCRKLGCSGYKEFQRELVYELASMEDANDVAIEDISSADGADRILRKVVQSDIRSLEALERLLDPGVLEDCVAAIASARVVNLFGVGASLLVARDLELKLNRVDKQCHVYEDWHSQMLCARNIHADDLALVFSYSGLTREMVEVARLVRQRGARLIAVTRIVGSELAEQADWVLGLATSEPLVRSGAMASRMSQLAVVDALHALYVARDYDRCAKTMLQNYDEKRPKGENR